MQGYWAQGGAMLAGRDRAEPSPSANGKGARRPLARNASEISGKNQASISWVFRCKPTD